MCFYTVQTILGEPNTLVYHPLVTALRDIRNGRTNSAGTVMRHANISKRRQASASQSLQSIVQILVTLLCNSHVLIHEFVMLFTRLVNFIVDPRFKAEFELERRHHRRLVQNVGRRRSTRVGLTDGAGTLIMVDASVRQQSIQTSINNITRPLVAGNQADIHSSELCTCAS